MWEAHPNDFWVFPRWRTTHFQTLSTFQDGNRVKFFTRPRDRCGCQNPHPGRASRSQIPVGCPPPPILGQTIDRCIILLLLGWKMLFVMLGCSIDGGSLSLGSTVNDNSEWKQTNGNNIIFSHTTQASVVIVMTTSSTFRALTHTGINLEGHNEF